MTANAIECPVHGWYAAGFGTCPECSLPRATLQTTAPQAVTVVRGKKSRKRETGKPETRAKTPDWNTASVKPRIRKGDGSLQAKIASVPVEPKTVISLLKAETKQRIIGIDAILAKLVSVGMDTDSKIAEGLRTGRVVQAIGWEKNYQKVIDYLIAEGYNVGKHRFYIVCGGLAA